MTFDYRRLLTNGSQFTARFFAGKFLSHGQQETNFFDFNYGETDIPEFSAFKIKIVMKGTNPAYPPRVKDMRTIALAI